MLHSPNQFADNILKVIQMTICVTDWVENIMAKGENIGYKHFLLFQLFSNGFIAAQGHEKSGLCGEGVTSRSCGNTVGNKFTYWGKISTLNECYLKWDHSNPT